MGFEKARNEEIWLIQEAKLQNKSEHRVWLERLIDGAVARVLNKPSYNQSLAKKCKGTLENDGIDNIFVCTNPITMKANESSSENLNLPADRQHDRFTRAIS